MADMSCVDYPSLRAGYTILCKTRSNNPNNLLHFTGHTHRNFLQNSSCAMHKSSLSWANSIKKEVKFRRMLRVMQTVLISSSGWIFVDKPVYPSIIWFYYRWRNGEKEANIKYLKGKVKQIKVITKVEILVTTLEASYHRRRWWRKFSWSDCEDYGKGFSRCCGLTCFLNYMASVKRLG